MLSDSWLIESLHGPPEQARLGPDSRRGDAARQDVAEALGRLGGGGGVSSKETGPPT